MKKFFTLCCCALFGSMLITWGIAMLIHIVVYRFGPWRKKLPPLEEE